MVSGQDIVNEAKKHLGKPVEYGEMGPDKFDPAGLVVYVFKQAANISLPHNLKQLINMGKNIKQKDLQLGDLVFPSAGHVGIYAGNGEMIQAPYTCGSVNCKEIPCFYAGRRVIK